MSGPLISPEDLARRLDTVEVFDLRWSLTDPSHGVNSYRGGHIPGAVFVDLDLDLSVDQGDGRHPLPSLDVFAATLGRLGITADTPVMVYDDIEGSIAARLWWMLTSIGHRDVALLDGGLAAWSAAGLPLISGDVQPTAATYVPAHDFTGVARYHDLEGRVVVDVRAAIRYTGEHEPIDPKAGHIPGAVNLPLVDNLDVEGRFLGKTDLVERFAPVSDDPVVSCGSGVNACHTALAMRYAGLDRPDVYVGSFSDWSSRDLPVNTGPRP